MIIWLASYPKSGNTWIRIFLNTLLFSENDTKVDINKDFISQFPLRNQFKNLSKNIDDINEIAKNSIYAQEYLNLDNKIKILKTHSALWRQNESNYNFTNSQNTLGVIYVIRDPRNVITSVLNYFHKTNYKDALDFMMDAEKILGNTETETGVPTIISSWANHFNSWKKFNKNYLLIKYENLLEKPYEEFIKITHFLKKVGKYQFDEDKLIKVIDNCRFEKMSEQEQNYGFIGNSIKNRKLNKNFFNLGPKNNWKKLLDIEIIKKIENTFKLEMQEVGYLK